MSGGQDQVRIDRNFIWIIYSRKAFDLSPAGFSVHAFNVTFFANFDWRIDKDKDEAIAPNQISGLVTRNSIRTHGGANHGSVMPDDL